MDLCFQAVCLFWLVGFFEVWHGAMARHIMKIRGAFMRQGFLPCEAKERAMRFQMNNIKKTIYLSPSNQHNSACIGGYTEKMLMEPVADAVFRNLKRYDCNPVYTTIFNPDGSYTGRPAEAERLKADVYIAIHSNSTGVKGACATGAVGYYYGGSRLSLKLAEEIQARLDRACPIRSNRVSSIVDGTQAFNGYGYGELREPERLGITAVLIETNFHSYEPTCRYLLENPEEVGRCITEGVVSALGLSFISDSLGEDDETDISGKACSFAEDDNEKKPEAGYERDYRKLSGSGGDADSKTAAYKPSVGDMVYFKGGSCFDSSFMNSGKYTAKAGRAAVTRIVTEPSDNQIYPIHLVALSEGGSDAYGWVSALDITPLKALGKSGALSSESEKSR